MQKRIANAVSLMLALSPVVSYAQTAPPPAGGAVLESITVTGSMLRRTDTETPSPVSIITAEDITRTGLTSISDIIRTLSADNSGTLPNSFGFAFAFGASAVALRGLTVNSTLVLIDGRRAANYALADDGVRSFVDLNTIPVDAVERIEVLKDGASSIYGADAIAGVVNVILKTNYQGREAMVEFGNSQRGGGASTHVTATAGTGDLQADRFNAMVSFEYERDTRILNSDRPFPFNTNDLSSIGGTNLSAGQPGLNSGSVYGTVTPARLGTPGNLLTAIALPGALAQPLRPCGPGTTQVVDPAQGTYCSWQTGVFGNIDDSPNQERVGLYSRVSARLSDHMTAYVNASYYQNSAIVDVANNFTQTSVPNNTNSIALPPILPTGALNPNNPFANAACQAAGTCPYALINYAFGDIPTFNVEKNHNLRFVAGLKGDFAGWTYDTALVVNHTWLATTWNGLISFKQLMNDVTNGTYSFINPASNSAATRAAISAPASKTSTTDLDSIDFRITRDIGQRPGGPVGLGLGVEARYEANNDPNLNPNNDLQGLGISQTIGARNVFAGYVEFGLPVLKQLEFNVSGRFDHYSDFGDSTTPKIGVKWTPFKQVALRSTYSRGFRAPSFAENGSSASLGFITLTPPVQFPTWTAQHLLPSGQPDAYAISYTAGLLNSANKDIKAEKSESGTFGVVFEPAKWVNLSADYYVIKKTNVIVPPNASAGLVAYFSGMPTTGYGITLDNPDPLHPLASPRVTVVSGPYTNANSLTTDGVDVDARFRFNLPAEIGLTTNLSITEIFSWKQVFPGTPPVEQQYVGTEAPYILSSGAGTPRYRGSFDNTLTRGPATATATLRYVSGFAQTGIDATGSATACLSAPINNCHVASFTTLDMTGGYRFTDHLTGSLALLNVTNRLPPLNPANYAGDNYNPTYHYAGILGRFWRLGMNAKF